MPHANTILVPVADGGEGTTDSLVAATGGHLVDVTVTGPLGEAVQAQYGVLGDGQTCVIEMASASGLILVPAELRNPLVTTTFGTGQLISHALGSGFRRYLFAIGGSATNDGGIGMLQALGLSLTDSSGQSIGFGGGELSRIAAIDDAAWDTRISECQFTIASDVQNPLVGKEGASYVFGPQKGATSEMVEMLDAGMHNWADRIAEKTGKRLHDSASAGAAGGLGAAFQAFFPSIETRRGIDIVIELTQLREHLQGADLVITGEGRIDEQTASGKTPMGIAQEAQKLGIPVVVLAGSVGKGIESLYPVGVTSIHSIMNAPMSLQEAMLNAAELLQDKAEQVVRTFLAR
ncbi:glycerate kinase [Paenibacillus eucommiae]|uniref:Glycerate kinase n=1 Tax=Paenibacillus eucommiae TaxID=1355755 RepID=A0ABS4INI2_9BACL|nr:glycerate kinase [Paenibacillus eucommiae]